MIKVKCVRHGGAQEISFQTKERQRLPNEPIPHDNFQSKMASPIPKVEKTLEPIQALKVVSFNDVMPPLSYHVVSCLTYTS